MSAKVVHVGLSEADYELLTALAKRCGRARAHVAALAIAVFLRHPQLEGDELLETLAELAAPASPPPDSPESASSDAHGAEAATNDAPHEADAILAGANRRHLGP